jgi:hypothetical protein
MTQSMAAIIGIEFVIEFTYVPIQKLNLLQKRIEDMLHLFSNNYIQKTNYLKFLYINP